MWCSSCTKVIFQLFTTHSFTRDVMEPTNLFFLDQHPLLKLYPLPKELSKSQVMSYIPLPSALPVPTQLSGALWSTLHGEAPISLIVANEMLVLPSFCNISGNQTSSGWIPGAYLICSAKENTFL